MKLETFELVLDRDSATYLAGELISGCLLLNAAKPLRLSTLRVEISGTIHSGWTSKNSDLVYDSRMDVLEDTLDLGCYLNEVSDDGDVLPRGEHRIGFQFTLPLDLISSMYNDYYGWVRYTCTALLVPCPDAQITTTTTTIMGTHHTPNSGGQLGGAERGSPGSRSQSGDFLTTEKPFTVFSLLSLDAPHFRRPASCVDSCEIIGCFCRKRGRLSAKMIINEQGLLPGETAHITLIIENNARRGRAARAGKSKCPVVALCQQLDFRAQNKYDADVFDLKSLTMAVASLGICVASQDMESASTGGPQTKLIDFPVPRALPPTSTKSNGLITISYFFKLALSQFELILPVVIGTVKTFDNDELLLAKDLLKNCHPIRQNSATADNDL